MSVQGCGERGRADDVAGRLARWEASRPLLALWSAPEARGVAPGVILAQPSSTQEVAGVEEALAPMPDARADDVVVAVLPYELGEVIEPAVLRRGGGRATPGARAWRVEARDAGAFESPVAGWSLAGDRGEYLVRGVRSLSGRAKYEAGVERVLEHIRAGDAYQVNLAHMLEGGFEGSPRAFFRVLMDAAHPWFGAYVERIEGESFEAVVSASPEMFLGVEGESGRVRARPMKGTRARAEHAEEELRASVKDQAELNMIVDLMRHDLGRACRLGSIRVDDPRRIERHAGGTILQATAEVSGTLRVGAEDLVRGCFPPGSVTGAPKIRAMQIIRELEPVPRGAYCGSIALRRANGDLTLSVAIRTATIRGRVEAPGRVRGTIRYGVGAGIVADSDPSSEWRETMEKARVFLDAAGVDVRSLE